MKKVSILALAVLASLAAPSARAYQLAPGDLARVRMLSDQLATQTSQLSQVAENNRHHYTLREEQALERLNDLEYRSRLFRSTLRARSSDPGDSGFGFDDVVAAYTRASSAADDLHAYNDVATNFDPVEQTMNELTDLFGGPDRFWGRRRDRGGAPTILVPPSTPISVAVRNRLRSRDLRVGQQISMTLADDLVVYGRLIAPRGSEVLVRITDLRKAGRVKTRERISFELAAMSISARMQTVETYPVSYEADGTGGKDARTIVGGTIAGALLGAITGGGDDAVKGAAIGAAAGTGVVLTTRGRSVHLEPGERIEFRLAQPLRVRVPGGPRNWERNDRDRRNDLGGHDVSRR